MTTTNHVLEDNNFRNHCCKNFISHMGNFCLSVHDGGIYKQQNLCKVLPHYIQLLLHFLQKLCWVRCYPGTSFA